MITTMSADAETYLKRIGQALLATGASIHLHGFDRGISDAVHDELRRLGLIRLLGTRGGRYVLTALGETWGEANCR